MERYNVHFYETDDGAKPVESFLLGLDKKMRTKAIRLIEVLRDSGTSLREPYSKPLSDGIFELRIQVGNNATRILYFFCVGRNIILTNGFVKKTQKTPLAEIQIAKQRRADYLSRKENDR